MSHLSIGSIVKCRGRQWVVIPSDDRDLIMLRPLAGSDHEICGIHKELSNLGLDRIEPAQFSPPTPDDVGDSVGSKLLWNSARLILRDGAAPFRSLGRVSVRPRPYQFVPLLMALRLDPIRMLIADDVGIGKTIEALLIARELLDRGEIKRVCVLCPPYLCDQWMKEMHEKFHIDAVTIRSGTISQLEKNLPSSDHSIFSYYPHIVVSIDYAKSERHRHNFIQNCPEFVIVDEAHGVSHPTGNQRTQHQRHALVKEISEDPKRHILLLTATPHSGLEDPFRSLLEILSRELACLNLQNLTPDERGRLARYFIQRKRADVKRWLGGQTPFPERDFYEETYQLSNEYKRLFDMVYRFSSELVRSGQGLTDWKRRIRYWTALALLRCVMSSPESAITSLSKRGKFSLKEEEDIDQESEPYIYENPEKESVDSTPSHILDKGRHELSQSEEKRLKEFAKLALEIKEKGKDTKLKRLTEIVKDLLEQGFNPIVWCRYISTSDYVADALKRQVSSKFKGLLIQSITGTLSEEERREKVQQFRSYSRRVLVATDCLSEGINLQEYFSAVIHYDLPWNPNRLEQREGRVDRFGQVSPKVKAVLLYGKDNHIDGAVLDVLLRKAREIRKTLGISVPVPVDSETVMEAVLNTLFFKKKETPDQLMLFEDPAVKDLHKRWDMAKEKERESRTRFAQKAINPEEVEKELKKTDSVLGDPDAVKDFVLNACQRLNIGYNEQGNGIYLLYSFDNLPDTIKAHINTQNSRWKVSFLSPTPPDTTFLGRNHPFVSALATFLFEEAMAKGASARASRCGVIRTHSVQRRTTLLLLRLRFTIEEPELTEKLGEEITVIGFRGYPPENINWLSEEESLMLLNRADADAPITNEERKENAKEILGWWDMLMPKIKPKIFQKAKELELSYKKIRASVRLRRKGLSVTPHLPPDLVGILVLIPIPKGVRQ